METKGPQIRVVVGEFYYYLLEDDYIYITHIKQHPNFPELYKYTFYSRQQGCINHLWHRVQTNIFKEAPKWIIPQLKLEML